MCPGQIIRAIFGGGPTAAPAPTPTAPTPPPIPQPTYTKPVEAPPTPTPAPYQEDETKRKAEVTSKKVQKKKRSAGTTQLATKKPTEGGLQGIKTAQGVNTGQPTKQTTAA